MSTVNYNHGLENTPIDAPKTISGSRRKSSPHYHRIAEVRQQQGVSLRSVARRFNLPIQVVRDQEEGHSDLHISDLLRWQEILDVPLVDLLVDPGGPLSEPVSRRAGLLRVMKTTKAIQEVARDRPVKRLANMLVSQLTQIMPELADVSAWHSVGQRRTRDEFGKIVERTVSENLFKDSNG